MAEDKTSMTMDEVKKNLEAIARDPNHRDHFKALKMLSAEETASVVLPDPLSYEEAIDRLARVMKPFGMDASQTAYHKAFPNSRRDVTLPPDVDSTHLTQEERALAHSIVSIPLLYKHFPEVKRNTVPKGYPKGQGMITQQDWLRKQAVRILVDKKLKLRKDEIEARSAEENQVREGESEAVRS